MSEFNWKTSDGINIYAKSWDTDNPKAVVLLVHGLGEHINRYDHLGAFLNKNGFALLGNDHRGHGQSGGPKGHIPSYEDLLKEVDQLRQEATNRYPDAPVFLYGHSLGGNIVLNYLLVRQPEIKGVIATGPALKLAFEPSAFLLFLGKLMRNIKPSFAQPNGLVVEHISRDKSVVEKYVKDPLVHDKVSSELGLATLERGKWALENISKINIPALVMHGEKDQITSPEGTKLFAEKGQGDITLKIWPELYHEIHNEPEQQQVFDFTLNWLNSKL